MYNGCSNFTTNVSVPLNGFGYQIPRTGQGYCGAGLKETTFYGDYKEYPAIKIKSKLQAGKKYRLTIHANLSNSSTLALDKISAVFVSDTIHGALNPNYTTYPVSPFDTKIDFLVRVRQKLTFWERWNKKSFFDVFKNFDFFNPNNPKP